MLIRRFVLLSIYLCVPARLWAIQPGPQDVFVRVVDSGAALCCVVQMPGPQYMIYDAGNYTGGGSSTFDKIQEIVPVDSDVQLLVLSHSDADHLRLLSGDETTVNLPGSRETLFENMTCGTGMKGQVVSAVSGLSREAKRRSICDI
jgi:hypothetical protein